MTRPMVSDPVRSPSVRQCCGAAAGLVLGMVRPKRPDGRFIRSIVDAGLPAPGHSVTVTALPQAPRPVPTAAIVEGTFTPARVENSLTSFLITHPEATFIVDAAVCIDVERRAIAQLPAVLRVAVRPPASTIPTLTALDRLPRVPRLDFALPTHAHWTTCRVCWTCQIFPYTCTAANTTGSARVPSLPSAACAIRCATDPSTNTT